MSDPSVPVVSPPQPPAPQTLVCANCGAALDGEYCSACGQRHEPHVHTLGHFAGEAFESISHADSRLWRTLLYLLGRPGFLTRQFFAGKRASYLPPFRLYLVISVLFFLVAGIPESGDLQIDATPTPESVAALNDAATVLENTPGAGSDMRKKAAELVRQQQLKESAALDGAKGTEGLQEQNGLTEFCDSFKKPDPRGDPNYARLQALCAKTAQDHGAALYKDVVHNIPRAMFIFLPLLALAMKLLYWRPKRYYVEHLLFLVHNHAFVFLTLAILALLGRIPVVGQHLSWLNFCVWLYLFWYLFRAMRNVYQQSRGLTLAKYFAIGFSYICAGITVLILTALYSALTIA